MQARDDAASGLIAGLVPDSENAWFYKQALMSIDYTGMDSNTYQEVLQNAYDVLTSAAMQEVNSDIQDLIYQFETNGVTEEGYKRAGDLWQEWYTLLYSNGMNPNIPLMNGLEPYMDDWRNVTPSTNAEYDGGVDTAEVASATEMVEDLTKAVQDLERAKAADKAESQGYRPQMAKITETMIFGGTDDEKRASILEYINGLYGENSEIVKGMLEQYPALAEVMSAIANDEVIEWGAAYDAIMAEMNEQTYIATASDEEMNARLHDLATEYMNVTDDARHFAQVMEENNDLNE